MKEDTTPIDPTWMAADKLWDKAIASKNKTNADYDKANAEIKRIARLISQGESK